MQDFELGQVVQTRGLYDAVKDNPNARKEIDEAFIKYINCEWGDLDKEDKKANDQAVKDGQDKIVARYTIKSLEKDIYIITEWDRSVTTLLFCDEY